MMKRLMTIFLCLAMTICLAACGTPSKPEPTAEPVPEATPEPTEESTTSVDEAQYEAARACIGRSVEELYDAVGAPSGGAQYAASCLEENAEDGMLYYEGFYVWTLKNDSGEIVQQVYLSE